MPALIRIGDRFVNLEEMTAGEVTPGPPCLVDLYFRTGMQLVFRDAEGIALAAYLTSQALDVMEWHEGYSAIRRSETAVLLRCASPEGYLGHLWYWDGKLPAIFCARCSACAGIGIDMDRVIERWGGRRAG